MAAAPLIAFYGDDFTGSTDALEVLAAAGLRAVLFTDVPSAEQLAHYQGLEAVGIAGHTRSLTPDEMEGVLPACYAALKASGAPILHYKVCSTFDSSAGIGSFGRAMDIARREIGAGTIPVVVGAPRLGRYSFFGTLFARDNADGIVHRIDRHSTMSRHPTTPMREGDMRRHIGAQTEQRIALLPAPAIGGTEAAALASLDAAMEDAPDALLIDIADETAEPRVGLLLERMAQAAAPLFVLGSSGVEYALVAHWTAEGRMRARREMPAPGAVDRLLVVSGSCSPVTGGQIAAAIEDGFAQIVIDPVALVRDGETSARDAVATAVELLEAGRSVIAHTSTGGEDPREAALIAHFAGRGVSEDEARLQGGRALATAAGRLLRDVLDRVELERFVVAGGDTSTAAMRMLGVEALEMIAPLSPGAPLCRILAPGHRLDGRQIVLKGGQMGAPAFFSQVREGRA